MIDEKSHISTSTRPMATKLDREVASHEKMLSTKLQNPLITWAHQVTWKIKNGSISISTRPVATKLDRTVAYDKKQQT